MNSINNDIYKLNKEKVLNSIDSEKLSIITHGRLFYSTTMFYEIIDNIVSNDENVLIFCNNYDFSKEKQKNKNFKQVHYRNFKSTLIGKKYDYIFVLDSGTIEFDQEFFTYLCNKLFSDTKIIISGSTNDDSNNFLKHIYFKSKDLKANVVNLINPNNIENFIDSPKNIIKYYNEDLGRYYNEKTLQEINNIKVDKVLYMLVLQEMEKINKEKNKSITINEYFFLLLQNNILKK